MRADRSTTLAAGWSFGLAPVSWTPGLSCYRFLFAPPLERPRAEIAERRMSPLPVVEDLKVIEQLGARRRPRGPRRVVHELDLQRREETLSHGIVPAIAAAAHAAHDSVLGQDALVVAAGVLTAAIGMMEQPLRRAPARQGHPERVEREVVRDALVHRPADGEARTEIEDHRQVEPTLARRNVGDVGDPRLVRPSTLELPRARTLGAMGNGCRDCVVTRNRRRRRAASPRTRMSRATRLRPVRHPRSPSSA